MGAGAQNLVEFCKPMLGVSVIFVCIYLAADAFMTYQETKCARACYAKGSSAYTYIPPQGGSKILLVPAKCECTKLAA
jgi:hypothetical protein